MRFRFLAPRFTVVLLIIGAMLMPVQAANSPTTDSLWLHLVQSAQAAKKQGNYSQAEKNYQAALQRALQLKTNRDLVITSYHNLAAMLFEQGHYFRAVPMYKHAVAGYAAKMKSEASKSRHATCDKLVQEKRELADCYRAEAKYKLAETEYRDALKLLSTDGSTNKVLRASIQSELADTLSVLQRYAEAERLYKEALPVFESAHVNDLLVDLLQDYDALLRITNRDADAEKIEAQLSGIRLNANEASSEPVLR